MSQSPELAGGEGFTFEGDVAAFYLAAMLAEAYAPGMTDRMFSNNLGIRSLGFSVSDRVVPLTVFVWSIRHHVTAKFDLLVSTSCSIKRGENLHEVASS